MQRRIRTVRSAREALARERALAALADMRREGVSLRAATRREGVSPRTVKRYVASALRLADGRYRPTSSDRLTRHLHVLTAQGPILVAVRGSRAAARVSGHANAVGIYLRTGNRAVLAPFEGLTVRAGRVTYPLITDPALLHQLADADELKIDGLYRSVRGAR